MKDSFWELVVNFTLIALPPLEDTKDENHQYFILPDDDSGGEGVLIPLN